MRNSYVLRFHALDLPRLLIYLNIVEETLPQRPSDIHFSELDGKVRLYAIFEGTVKDGTKMIIFKEGDSLSSKFT